ncbi:MAG: 3-deoxy-7-phosphoheptulonate synthase [Ferrovum sp. 37-45-19]|jgi:3-deoxy-7-phosphoheptulonate synthase|uniref:3-deoxy-7-phosphoheptulonate synthase AroG n=1 Tax=Ferrovum sp. JA12 TaxID=1356299 RepID=UPI000703963B|nr:3-deoxy-7-phosphoheptulonate synthase AroG [Ferrovum sp. JA12]OYV80181.1 MAG: 3-deoxy-7-phosphoheptulonate synthase [Ferrovum sp. 21-44-67]OYV94458.1 MAG: 3-deoxy-7-phosphoheptulonate synthase [Ferrovum sp. 37-45-19]OZB32441.1 MAG: 3-deoxy-7-phosphoheptulonate synthase [Ferrovum sp. 34-44-207]HQT81645.1 3-deoxy-7-phosphoheptulonate synthase AroG [Ferrovaceae bacterium]KRH78860.1 phospho-2-dehydro-3-deoxyheptonate aldolase, Phe-sensitive [Ferrovum sp. JA12]
MNTDHLFKTDDLRIREIKELSPPAHLLREFPISENASTVVSSTRQQIHHILQNDDDRLLVIVGPCSIHDPVAAMEYASMLKPLKEKYASELLIVMRVYFEKPRTTVGWKGLINDPYLDGTFQINEGLKLARGLLLEINEMGMPAGTEFLDLITPQYFADLISWGAIGARTTESQVHRELASGLSCPVGFKNGTDGNLKIAIDAIRAAQQPHHFLSVTKAGHSAIVATNGNEDCHVILRGGKSTNYDAESIEMANAELVKAGLSAKVMIDFSHANSQKDPQKQLIVSENVANQIIQGEKRIMGVMIESHIVGGRQDLESGKSLTYGQSITDACVSFADTETILDHLALSIRLRRQNNR